MSKFMVSREQLEDGTVYYQVISAEMHEFLSAAHIEADRLNQLLENAERNDTSWRSIIRYYDADVARLREALSDMALIHPETAYKLAHDVLPPKEVEP
jgi:hypothetical protein